MTENLENRVTKLLGIKYPIVQGALGEVSEDPRFVAAVSNAGCLGILAAVGMGAEGVRESIRELRELTDKPFGVNILPPNPQYKQVLEVMIDEEVPVFCHGRYNPVQTLQAARRAHTVSLPTVGSVKHAVQAEKDGADALLVTGTEAGGHTGYVGTIVLVPAVAAKVNIPIIGGGGVATPEQFAAILCMGAEGLIMGTRFMMTKECPMHPNAIKKLLEATEEDTYASVHVSGRHHRWLVSPYIRENIMPLPEIKGEDHYNSFVCYAGKACIEGDVERGIVGSGQGIGLIDDLPSIQELVDWMMEGVEKVIEKTAKFPLRG